MKDEERDARRDEILDAAVSLIAEQGYRRASMLAVARRASASKETLYAWFGDKRGLYAAAIRRNAERVGAALAPHLDGDADLKDGLENGLRDFGAALLAMLTSDGAVALNRAAIAEAGAEPGLAEMLAELGRAAILPGFIAFLEARAPRAGLAIDDPALAAEEFLGLLLGDLQIRRLLGVAPRPAPEEIRVRAERAARRFLALYAA